MGMVAAEAAATSSILLPSRLATPASMAFTRSVSMRPGAITLTVMPSFATSRLTVLDQPTRLARSVLDMPRLGIGAITPIEVEVMTRPHFRAFMPGSTRSVIAMTESTIDWKCFVQTSCDWPAAGEGGGPPVLLTRMSIGPSSASIFAIEGSINERSPRSQTRLTTLPPLARSAAAVFASFSALVPVMATATPSSTRTSAIAAPSPPLEAVTNATFPLIPRSIPHLLKKRSCRVFRAAGSKRKARVWLALHFV